MKHLLPTLVLILSIIQSGKSHSGHKISCFVCNGHEIECTKATMKADRHRYLKDCQGVGDRCMRIWQKFDDGATYVHSLCADERRCDEMEKVCDKEKTAKDHLCAVSCCHDDACNSADTSVNFSLCLVILCIAVGVIEVLNFT